MNPTFFGGTSAEITWNSRNKIRPKNTIESLGAALKTRDSKLMIGGSNDDVLIRESDQDDLVGDRIASMDKCDDVTKDRFIANSCTRNQAILYPRIPQDPI